MQFHRFWNPAYPLAKGNRYFLTMMRKRLQEVTLRSLVTKRLTRHYRPKSYPRQNLFWQTFFIRASSAAAVDFLSSWYFWGQSCHLCSWHSLGQGTQPIEEFTFQTETIHFSVLWSLYCFHVCRPASRASRGRVGGHEVFHGLCSVESLVGVWGMDQTMATMALSKMSNPDFRLGSPKSFVICFDFSYKNAV